MASDDRFGEYPTTEAPRLCPGLIEYTALAKAAIADPDFEWDENEVSADDLKDHQGDNNDDRTQRSKKCRARNGTSTPL